MVKIVWLSARYGTGAVGFAPLTIFKCRRQDWRRAFLRGGNVRREIRGLQPSVAILQHSPKQKSEEIKFGKCGYLCSSQCLKKSEKFDAKELGAV